MQKKTLEKFDAKRIIKLFIGLVLIVGFVVASFVLPCSAMLISGIVVAFVAKPSKKKNNF